MGLFAVFDKPHRYASPGLLRRRDYLPTWVSDGQPLVDNPDRKSPIAVADRNAMEYTGSTITEGNLGGSLMSVSRILPGALLCLVVLLATGAVVWAGPVTYAPDWELEDTDGAVHRLRDYRGYIILMNFYATWCPPCRAEAPDLLNLANEYTPQGVRFFQLACCEHTNDRDEWRRLSQGWKTQYGVWFPVLLDFLGRTYGKYGDGYIPYNSIVDRDGVLLYGSAGYNESRIRTRFESALNQPPFTVSSLTVTPAGGTQVRLDWSKPFEGDIASWRIQYGIQAGSYSDFFTIDQPTADSYTMDLYDDTQAYFFAVNAIDQRGHQGNPSPETAFAFRPVCRLLPNKMVYRDGDTIQLDYWFLNGTSQDKTVDVYFVLELGGVFYFVTPAGEFVKWAASHRTTISAGTQYQDNLLTIPLHGVGDLPDICGKWYMALIDTGTGEVYDLREETICFE
jgi:peroxiredoxin